MQRRSNRTLPTRVRWQLRVRVGHSTVSAQCPNCPRKRKSIRDLARSQSSNKRHHRTQRFDAAPKVSVVRRCLPRLAERREPASSWFPWLSKSFRGRTCWQHGGREFSRRHHSPCAYRRRMLRGRERPVGPAEGGIRVAKPVLMTPRSEQRQRQST